MMKSCLLCDTKVKFIKFKCKDGYLCKACYEKVSLNFQQTVKTRSKAELLTILEKEKSNTFPNDFEISRKINHFVLFDDLRKQICLPNHRKHVKVKSQPEFFAYKDIKACSVEEKSYLQTKKGEQKQLGTIKVIIQLQQSKHPIREIWLIPKPIKVDSSSYLTMKSLAKKIANQLESL